MNRLYSQHILTSLLMLNLLSGCATDGANKSSLTIKESTERELIMEPSLASRLQQRLPEQSFNANSLSLQEPSLAKAPPPIERSHCVKQPAGIETDSIHGLNIIFFEMPLREALVELSVMSNIPIMIDEGVDGLITVNMSNVSFDAAMDVMLSGGDIAYRKMSNHLLVGSALPHSPVFHKLATNCHYRPRYTKPIDLAASLTPYFQQFINIPKDSDFLTITAVPKTLERIRAQLNNFDRKPRQLLMEMHIVEVSSKAMDLIGVDWNRYGRDPNTKSMRRMGTTEWSGTERGADLTSNPVYSFGYLPIRTLTDSLNFLRTSGEAEIKAMPSIVTLDGKEAVFSSTSRVWLPFASSGNSGSHQELVYGVDMRVIPRITAANEVKLNIINVSVSDLTTNSQGDPSLVLHSISNTVHVKDGDYLVLGGLLQKKSRKTHEGLPILKDTPLIGMLFGQEEEELIETEVLIMIRPKILGG
jgi:type II secretory pathway component GspD/PulD (secretin)